MFLRRNKPLLAVFMVLVVLTPALAVDIQAGVELDNSAEPATETLQEQIYDEIMLEAKASNNKIAQALLISTAGPSSAIQAFITTINQNIEFWITMLTYMLLLAIFILVEIGFFKLWTFLIKSGIIVYSIAKIIRADDSEIPDILEAISSEGRQIGKSLRKKLKTTSSNATKSIAKASAILKLI